MATNIYFSPKCVPHSMVRCKAVVRTEGVPTLAMQERSEGGPPEVEWPLRLTGRGRDQPEHSQLGHPSLDRRRDLDRRGRRGLPPLGLAGHVPRPDPNPGGRARRVVHKRIKPALPLELGVAVVCGAPWQRGKIEIKSV